jgi:SAM-dependent methyltransferase
MSNYRNQLNDYLSVFKEHAGRVLAIGIERDDRKTMPLLTFDEWKTMDINPEFKPDVLFDLNKPVVNPNGEIAVDDNLFDSFDMVIAWNLFDYIYNPLVALENIHAFLKAGGIFLTCFPFIYPSHPPIGTDYLRYTPDGVKKLLREARFEVEESVDITGAKSLLAFYSEDGMKMSKGYNHELIGLIIKAKKL